MDQSYWANFIFDSNLRFGSNWASNLDFRYYKWHSTLLIIKEDLEKLQNLIEQKKDIKKLGLNRKIQKETLNKDLAEIYAPITKNQKEQTEIIKEGQENQLKAIQDQTDQIKAITLPSTSAIEPTERSIPAIESSQSEDEFYDSPTQSIDSDIQSTMESLSNKINPTSLPNFKFTKSDINNYKINNKPFKIVDNKLIFAENEIQITPSFFNLFIKNNRENYLHLTYELNK